MNSILLIASPGAGKGIISDYLENKYNLIHLSTGNLLREAATIDNDLSNKLKSGDLIDDEYVFRLVSDFLKKNNGRNFTFDGFPRTMNQVKNFENIINKNNVIVDKVIFIDIDKEIAINRITSRIICDKCGHVFNKNIFNITSDICPLCKGNLYTRSDDTEKVFLDRYDTFINDTMPIINYFKNNYKFYEISNNSDLKTLYLNIDSILKEDEIK